MIRIYPEQLASSLQESLRGRYLIWGSEPLLIQESQDAIRQVARQQGFEEHFTFALEQNTDWDEIFSLCQALSLFASRQMLTLFLPENGPNAAMADKLTQLAGLLHSDLLLVLRGHKLTKAQENSAWFKAISQDGIYVSCLTPEYQRLPQWVSKRASQMRLSLETEANQLLCYCYEGNLLGLAQALERLSLLYPDGKLTYPRVESAVNDSAHFTPYHWVDAILAGKPRRSWHILEQLKQEDVEPVILLRAIQRELMLLITLKRQSATTSLKTLFDQHKVWQNRRGLLGDAIQRLSLHELQSALMLLTQAEIHTKQDFANSSWSDLQSLSMLLCGKKDAEHFIQHR
ncbi:DNA polymerase III subunit delta [Providencia zhijiangensis]|uniref:DNA polymerase III subunit delta n=1 Tax=Providencia zhijiangensis TaxID=3053982 RepID=A0ABZ0N3T2_9GAMM|nr:DNA polymerase III subunit delta [Providencia sp. D4759]WPA93025.1 DNA polymerase III subunit delta [Providencia sp. D4759]